MVRSRAKAQSVRAPVDEICVTCRRELALIRGDSYVVFVYEERMRRAMPQRPRIATQDSF